MFSQNSNLFKHSIHSNCCIAKCSIRQKVEVGNLFLLRYNFLYKQEKLIGKFIQSIILTLCLSL